MPEFSNDAELFTGTGPAKEGHEKSFEQFQDEQRQTQAALQQLWKEEGKVKQQDDSLAQIIVRFLNDPANTHLFLLIARCVAQNVPSEFIISIIALIDRGADNQVKLFLASSSTDFGTSGATSASATAPNSALVVRKPDSFETMPMDVKIAIDRWTQSMQKTALKMPQRVLDSVAPKPVSGGRSIGTSALQLASVVLRDSLAKVPVTIEFSALQDFIQLVLVEIVKNVEGFLAGQKQLA